MSQRKLFSKKNIAKYLEAFITGWEPTSLEQERTGFFCDHKINPALQVQITLDPTRNIMWYNDNLLIEASISRTAMHTEVLRNVEGVREPRTLPLYINELVPTLPLSTGVPIRGRIRKQLISANKLIPAAEVFFQTPTWGELRLRAAEAWETLADISVSDEHLFVSAYANKIILAGLSYEVIPVFQLPLVRYRINPAAKVDPRQPEYLVYFTNCNMGVDTAMIYGGRNPYGTKQLDTPVEVPIILEPQIESFLEGLLQ